jgi:hypothetical protein
MAQKKRTIIKISSVRRADGAFMKFYPLGPEAIHVPEWRDVALSYLTTRAEFLSGMAPGYCIVGDKTIIGFNNNQTFVS